MMKYLSKIFNFRKQASLFHGHENKHVYKLLSLSQIQVISNNAVLEIGMSISDVNKYLTPVRDSIRQSEITNTETGQISKSTSIWYNDMSIHMEFWDNKLIYCEFPNDAVFLFNKINLADINYAKTLRRLRKFGLSIRENNKNESIIDELNLIFYYPDSPELETVGIFKSGMYLYQ